MSSISPYSSLIVTLAYHYKDMVDYVRGRFGNRQFAHDVVHDVCLQLIEHPPKEVIHTPLAFLRQAMKNRAIDLCRSGERRRCYIDSVAEIPDVHAHDAHDADGAAILDFTQRLEALKRIIESLPPRQQQVFLLHRLHGMPQLEIAQELGISRNMVTQHFSRAMATIQRMWHWE
jgi:RNA polymerase sigma factor (sigma-70 family)